MGRFDNPRESSDTDWRLHVRTRGSLPAYRTGNISNVYYPMGEALIEEHAETSQDWEWWERTMLRALPSVLLMGCSSDRVGKNC